MRALGRPGVSAGVAAGEYTLQTSGSSVHAMMQNASGALKASVRNLDIVGVDLERALRRTERRPLSIPTELRTGQTSFASAEIDGKIDNGLFRLSRAIATGPGVEASLQARSPCRNVRCAWKSPPSSQGQPDPPATARTRLPSCWILKDRGTHRRFHLIRKASSAAPKPPLLCCAGRSPPQLSRLNASFSLPEKTANQ